VSRRDRAWRAAGAALIVGACAAALAMEGSALVLLALPVTLIGLALVVNGKRVGIAVRAERRGHCHTAEVIHAQRLRRRHGRRDRPQT
jgi:hypothetical protein